MRISSFESRCSSHTASIASWTLRLSVRSGERYAMRASCCVIVLPPSRTPPAATLRYAARSNAGQINAVVLVETAILDGDNGAGKVGRHILRAQLVAFDRRRGWRKPCRCRPRRRARSPSVRSPARRRAARSRCSRRDIRAERWRAKPTVSLPDGRSAGRGIRAWAKRKLVPTRLPNPRAEPARRAERAKSQSRQFRQSRCGAGLMGKLSLRNEVPLQNAPSRPGVPWMPLGLALRRAST